MKILWFVADIENGIANISSNLASVRRRCLEVLRGIGSLEVDLQVELILVKENMSLDTGIFRGGAVAIFNKMVFDCTDIVNYLKQNNIPVLFDGVDLYRDESVRNVVLSWSDYAIYSNNYFNSFDIKDSAKQDFCIADIQEGQAQPISLPEVNAEVIRVLWYGGMGELDGLRCAVQQFRKLEEYKIEIQALLSDIPDEEILALNNDLPLNLSMTYVNWSYENYLHLLPQVDVVILVNEPSNALYDLIGDPIASALWNGKVTMVSEAWQNHPMSDFILVASDVTEGVRRILTRLHIVQDLISRGQYYIAEHNDVAQIAQQWIDMLKRVTGIDLLADGGEQPATQVIRLKIGAGSNTPEGYVLVDEVKSTGVDVVCNLKTLDQFQEDTADEILCVGNIDQFYQWEIADVLRAWARVLKPGGSLVIECADFAAACRQFLQETESGNTADSLKNIYGDPAQRNPEAYPKWGYTAESLKRLMLATGLEQVISENPQVLNSQGVSGELRVVGVKPSL